MALTRRGFTLGAVATGAATVAGLTIAPRTPGLADSSWTSLRSHNFPDRYLRHSGYLLRIDPLTASSSLTDRQDATFRLTS